METQTKNRILSPDRYIPNRNNSNFKEALDSPSFDIVEPDLYNEILKDELFPNIKRVLSFDQKPYTMNPRSLQSYKTEKLLSMSPSSLERHIDRTPSKVLDAPGLQDDFYLNLVDWGSADVLGVGLLGAVYLWNSVTSKVTRLLSFEFESVTSVSWMSNGNFLAIGCSSGEIQYWDVQKQTLVLSMTHNHTDRVSSLSWNGNLLSSGSRDKCIATVDIRQPSDNLVTRFWQHEQEVCGLKWSPDGKELASGGNDNKVVIWSLHSKKPIHKFKQHIGAVKALAWCPHTPNLLASGGGSACKQIRFWNTQIGQCLNVCDTGSQVCCLAWSKNMNEIVSTHGFSLHQIVVWKCSLPIVRPLATLTGHTYRVLYLSVSPDGQQIVTGAGDETLRFWNIWPPSNKVQHTTKSSKIQLDIR